MNNEQYSADNVIEQTNTNTLLAYNISLLTQYSTNNYNLLYNEVEKLRDENKDLKDSNSNLRKREFELERENNRLERVMDKERSKKPRLDVEKVTYEIKKYRLNKDSYNDITIKKTIRNIKDIKDIIKLENKWRSVRHNTQLQKLYYLIEPLKKLDEMIGLEDLKKEVMKKIIYYIQNPFNEEYLHTILSGPPGVGKTEVAKIYAEIFQKLGILKNKSFIEVKRDQLVGEYLGQTAPKTRKVLESGMGGVIFIDEAYSLGNPEKRDSFSKECIDMINQFLSEYKNDFMMIIAGYDEELKKCFFSYNPGLRRRFSTYFNIEGYNSEELHDIFKIKLKKFKYNNRIESEKLKKFFKDNHESFKHFGGDVEKLVNELKYVQANRTFYEDVQNNKDIKYEDLINALNNFKKNSDKQKEEYKPPFGMYV